MKHKVKQKLGQSYVRIALHGTGGKMPVHYAALHVGHTVVLPTHSEWLSNGYGKQNYRKNLSQR